MDFQHANGAGSQPMSFDDHDDSFEDYKVPVSVEVCLKPNSVCSARQIADALARFLEGRTIRYGNGPLDLSECEDAVLLSNVESVAICDTDPLQHRLNSPLLFWQYTPRIFVYQLSEEGPADDDEGEEGVPSYRELMLPATDLAGQWEALHFDSAIQQRLLSYATSALMFADRGVDANLVAWNRVVLLYGPPGTGKTSLCKALAHKLSIRLGDRYRQGCLVEVNAHSLFSKYFSESGKLVSRLFSKITELVEEPDSLVFVLIDEVESLTSARKAAVAGSEPSDAIRAVNALLTQLDALRRFPNVMVLTTSNITQAIDVAFVDRADIKAYIGPPTLPARYEMLRGSVRELSRKGIIAEDAAQLLLPYSDAAAAAAANTAAAALGVLSLPNGGGGGGALPAAMQAVTSHAPDGMDATHSAAAAPPPSAADGGGAAAAAADAAAPPSAASASASAAGSLSSLLLAAAAACEGLSGRTLRKLPFLAHAGSPALALTTPCGARPYLRALREAAAREQSDREQLLSG
ncbi:hypothetical protein PLESTM_001259200 [Pleodorina starrii]|nr:hypothetical protein PLESTM_001259200 [Pleodorina starrii]